MAWLQRGSGGKAEGSTEDMIQKYCQQSVHLCGCERSRGRENWRPPIKCILRSGHSFWDHCSINTGSEWQSYLFGAVGKLADSGPYYTRCLQYGKNSLRQVKVKGDPSLIRSFNRYLLNATHVSATIWGTENIEGNTVHPVSVSPELTLNGKDWHQTRK